MDNFLILLCLGFGLPALLYYVVYGCNHSNYNTNDTGENSFGIFPQLYSERDRFVQNNAHMVKKIGKLYRFFNKNVFCEYCPDIYTIKISDARDASHNFTASPLDKYQNKINMVAFLDSILFDFNEVHTYDILHSRIIRSAMFQVVENNPKKALSNNHFDNQYYEDLKERININAASEEDLAKLPGINIIKAKRLVQYRSLHGAFRSAEEFIKQANVKPHFESKIMPNIFLGRKKQNYDDNNNMGDDERVVDLE